MTSFLESHQNELNEPQLEAVRTTDGPLLVLAGAGSGKTRMLTYRIAHLLYDLRTPMNSILAMTFSNKAAREMHDRIKKLLNDSSSMRYPWISTFHSVCVRLLRMYGSRLGYKPSFVIYDEGEQLGLLKTCIENLKFSDKELDPELCLRQIGKWKEEGREIAQAKAIATSSFEHRSALAYEKFQEALLQAQAMDFDDLILNGFKLFRDHPDVAEMYKNQWRYVLIDEFQDTNSIQYQFLKSLLNDRQNLCVVGDDDQSIYGWRGAKIENILNFDKEFQNAKVIRLEQNYRSTGNILKAADAIIDKNELRHKKTLWTDEGEGEKIRIAALEDDRSEASFIVRETKRYLDQGVPPSEIAVFYRMNSLSRELEEECLKRKIPYRIIGGFRFYERREIKDLLGYFRLLLNPFDIMSFRRTVNTPARGIGKTSVEKIEEAAAIAQKPIADWVREVPSEELPVTGKGKAGFSTYREILKWGHETLTDGNSSLVDLFIDGIQKSGYRRMLDEKPSEENEERKANIDELLSAVQEFEEGWEPSSDQPPEDTNPLKRKLVDFLERVSLMADIEQLAEIPDQITLMTLHSAKGLEFKVCFMCGMEEGLFPTARSFDSYERTEEERRLCYVGVTRARQKLYLTRANRRRSFGSINFNPASRFLSDLPKEILETVVDETSSYFEGGDGFDFRRRSPSYSSGPQLAWRKAKAPPKVMPEGEEVFDFDFDQRVAEFSFHKGDRVRHPSFGEGIVQKAELMGEEECLSIVFAGRGVKKVLAKFVQRR